MTRKTLITLAALALALSLSLVACSSGDDEEGSGAGSTGGGDAAVENALGGELSAAEEAPGVPGRRP